MALPAIHPKYSDMPLIGSSEDAESEPAPDADRATPPGGPQPGFDVLYEACADRLVRQTYLVTGDRGRAVHCVHRAFERAWADWDTVSADPSPEGWVRVHAFDRAASPWQRPPRRSGPAEGGGLTVQDRALLACLLRLPRTQRRALVLHDVLGLDWKQTSTETESTTPAAFARVSRARQAFAEGAPAAAGPDPLAPGFGRRLGARLREAADRACAQPQPQSAALPPGQVRRRSRLHEHCTTAGAALLTLGMVGGLVAGSVLGPPTHPSTPALVTYRGTHPVGTHREGDSPAPPADLSRFPALLAGPGHASGRTAAPGSRLDLRAVTALPDGFCSIFGLPCAHHHPHPRRGTRTAPHRNTPVRGSRLVRVRPGANLSR
jgi:DNA-directed RNA polymerase specialized sigma24 family protein